MTFKKDDRVDVSEFIKDQAVGALANFYENIGPMATILSVGHDAVCLRIDNYAYVDGVDEYGDPDPDYHRFSKRLIEKYLTPKMYEYSPSQEGDRDDDI